MSPEYVDFVMHHFKSVNDVKLDQVHAALGICTEAGELADNIKKVWVYEKAQDVTNVREELGDILFYFTAMCEMHGLTLGQIETENIRKLRRRYPTGYTNEAAQARADKA